MHYSLTLKSSFRSHCMLGRILLRNRNLRLMQVDPNHSPFPSSSSGSATLKRPYAHQATTHDNQPSLSLQSNMAYRAPHTQPEGGRFQRPAKAPKVEAAQAGSSSSSRFRDAGRGRHGTSFKPIRGSPLAGRPGGAGRGSGKSRGQSHIPFLPEPRHDLNYIMGTIKTKPLRQDFEDNAKSPLSNYHLSRYGTGVVYECTQYRSPTTPSSIIFRYV